MRSASSNPPRPALAALAFALLFALQIAALVVYRADYVSDDAAFFFRYAENLAAGHGYRWNVEEPPVWGASAPLWPLVLAAGILLGATVEAVCLAASWIFTLGATALVALVARRVSGTWGILALAAIAPLAYLYSGWATTGLESPLTFFVVALALAVASRPRHGVLLGLAAGLCMVQKVDLVPLGLALLAGTALWHRDRLRPAILAALVLAGAWYGFAAWHFGFPLPNSFLTKMTADYHMVEREWFARVTLVEGAQPLLLTLAAVGLVVLRRQRFVAALALVAIAAPLAGYTLRPPPEEFAWYTAPLGCALVLLATCGLAGLLRAIAGTAGRVWRIALAVAVLAGTAAALYRLDHQRITALRFYLNLVEEARAGAGRFVDRNTPPDARVYTGYGNIAFYSRRFVYDHSFLNRRPEPGDMLLKYAPEVFVAASFATGIPPEEFPVPRNYVVVRTFTGPLDSGAMDYYVVVMFREDLTLNRRDAIAKQHGGAALVLQRVLLELQRRREEGLPLERDQGLLRPLPAFQAHLRSHFEREERALASGRPEIDSEALAAMTSHARRVEARLERLAEELRSTAEAGVVPPESTLEETRALLDELLEHARLADALLRHVER
jgi:hypothetical protein